MWETQSWPGPYRRRRSHRRWARAVGHYVPVGEKLAADVLAAYHQAYSTR
jgi:hypothetical protein